MGAATRMRRFSQTARKLVVTKRQANIDIAEGSATCAQERQSRGVRLPWYHPWVWVAGLGVGGGAGHPWLHDGASCGAAGDVSLGKDQTDGASCGSGAIPRDS